MYTGGHRRGDSLSSDSSFLRVFALIFPDFAPPADPTVNMLDFFKTRCCPLGQIVTDFGHGFGGRTGPTHVGFMQPFFSLMLFLFWPGWHFGICTGGHG